MTKGELGSMYERSILQMKDLNKVGDYPSMLVVLCDTGNVLLKGQKRGQTTWDVLAFSSEPKDC